MRILVLVFATFLGLSAVEAQPKPVLVGLIGDSTVAVQSGWGPAFSKRFNRHATIVNDAKNGATLQALSKKLDELVLRQPDYVLIQFGHNDQKRYDTAVYSAHLKSYVQRIRQSGGKAVIVSSVTRRSFDKHGKIVSNLVNNDKYSYKGTLTDYAKAAEAVTQELNLPFIDLHRASIAHHNQIGYEASMTYNFAEGDTTHFNETGAEAITDLIIEELATNLPELASYLKVPVPATRANKAPTELATGRLRRVPGENADKLFESVLSANKPWPLQGGFAHLWLNRDLVTGNQLIRQAQQAIITNEGGADEMTPEIAASEHVKWQMRTWNRIYLLFNEKSRFHPGRLDPETQAMIEEMFWHYVCDKSRYQRAALQHVWGIHGSENHEMMHYSNVLLALQAIKDRPAYQDRKLPDGRSITEHYQAWNAYYKRYCVERAKHGLLIEIFSGYGKYTMPELFNMHDLAEDPVLRSRMGKLIDLIWADWAISQLNGVRGGGRLRLYQDDPAKPESSFQWGARDTWLSMSHFILDNKPWWNARSYHPHPIIGYPWVLATTQYRLPDVIKDIASDAEDRGEYNAVARRVAKQRPMDGKQVPVTESPWYALDPEDPRMLSYDHCTPDYVMGSLLIDPTLPRVGSRDYLAGNDLIEGYPALTSQNRYHGVTFASDVNARVIPQCEGLANGKTYGEQQAVQHDNVLLVQRHKQSKQTGDMRILFGLRGMKARLVEQDGWIILQEGNAWLGIKGFSRTDPNRSCGYQWDNEIFLRMADGNAPVALIAGRNTEFADFEAFASYLESFSGTAQDGWFKLSGDKLTLSLQLESLALPRVNGTAIDLRPPMLFDSPWMSSEHGSGIIRIHKDGRELKIDLNE